MKVVVVGGRGFIGSKLVDHLLETRKDWEVIVTTRQHAADVFIKNPHWSGRVRVVQWLPPNRPYSLIEAVKDDEYALVNLAGERITGPWTTGKRKKIWESRVETARALAEAFRNNPPKVFIQAEGTGAYGDRGEEEVTEDTPLGRGFLAGLSRALEEALEPLGKAGSRLVFARLGLVLGRESPLHSLLSKVFFLRLCFVLDSGAWMPWIHISDAVGAFILTLEDEGLKGPVNMVSPGPVRVRDFFKELCEKSRAFITLRIPQSLVRLAGGDFAQETLLSSCRAVPRKLLDAGYEFKYSQLTDALSDLF